MRPANVRLAGALLVLATLPVVAWRLERAPGGAAPAERDVAGAEQVPRRPIENPARPGGEVVAPAMTPRAPAAGPVIPSLAGTDVDGALETDGAAHFAATPAAVRLFEYYLSAEGEVPPEGIRARLAAEATRRLPPHEAARAMALFDAYVAYRGAVAHAQSGGSRGDLKSALAATHAARVAAFGERDAASMFGDEEAAARAEIAAAEARLSGGDTRSESVSAAEQDLPPQIRERHARRAARAAAVAAIVAEGSAGAPYSAAPLPLP